MTPFRPGRGKITMEGRDYVEEANKGGASLLLPFKNQKVAARVLPWSLT